MQRILIEPPIISISISTGIKSGACGFFPKRKTNLSALSFLIKVLLQRLHLMNWSFSFSIYTFEPHFKVRLISLNFVPSVASLIPDSISSMITSIAPITVHVLTSYNGTLR